MDADGDVFIAHLRGRLVNCISIDDAVAVKTAEALLRNGDAATPSELQRLAGILTRYDCHEEAQELSHQASRLRAAQFLKDSVGYVRSEGQV
jgi:hypothetical protein